MKKQYGGVTYSSEDNFNYSTNRDVQEPESLFKYFSFSKYSVEALSNCYLYASHPFDLNDLLDSKKELLYLSKKPNINSYRTLHSQMKRYKYSLNHLFENDKGEQYLENLYNATSGKLGIISLCSNPNSPLMWPHYTQEKGFQLEFDTKKLTHSIDEFIESERSDLNNSEQVDYIGLFPINYVSSLEALNVNEFIEQNGLSLMFNILYNIKHYNWSYEQEWRILISRSWMGIPFSKHVLGEDLKAKPTSRFAHYGIDAIRSITIGRHFFDSRIYKPHIPMQQESGKSTAKFTFKNDIQLSDDLIAIKSHHIKFIKFIIEEFRQEVYMSAHQVLFKDQNGNEIIRSNQKIKISNLKNEEYEVVFFDEYLNNL